jgi:hypothetical protein
MQHIWACVCRWRLPGFKTVAFPHYINRLIETLVLPHVNQLDMGLLLLPLLVGVVMPALL